MVAHPLPAATVVLVREPPDSAPAAGFEVFLVERPAGASFMAGAHVFPGGRLDACDAEAGLVALCDGLDQWPSRTAHDPAFSVPHGIAAIRELFEEAGVLLARPASPGRPGDQATGRVPGATARLEVDRRALHGGHLSLAELCAARGWRLALDQLEPLSRWITPEGERRRFDAAFFVARLPPDQVAGVDGVESVTGTWLTPAEAVRRHVAGTIALAPPTLRTLDDLSREPSLEAALASAKTRTHVPILPRRHVEDGRIWLLLPGDPLYPAEGGDGMAPPTRYWLRGQQWVGG